MVARSSCGFFLVELLLAVAIGLVLLGQIAQSTLQEIGHARRLGRLLRERVVTQRALELMRVEIQDAFEVSFALPGGEHADCNTVEHEVVLHLLTTAGRITYSVDSDPDAIWRGQALMRCGPSYGLSGMLKEQSSPVPRVILDALAVDGITFQQLGDSRGLHIALHREFKEVTGVLQRLDATLTTTAPGLPLKN